jgi:hypothetical protein
MNTSKGVAIMKMDDIRVIAKNLGVNPGAMNKQNLIRSIQEKEGNTPCFNAKHVACDQFDCCWRSDCKTQYAIAATDSRQDVS